MKKMIMVACVIAALSASALAWHAKGHRAASELAVAALPEDVPAFFRDGAKTVAEVSLDPDVFVRATVELRDAEAAEHYIDVENLGQEKLPATRYAMLELCFHKKLKPVSMGLLPYAVTEWTQRLTVAFAQYRKHPDDAAIQHKCLVYAGMLSHYSEDLCMPLHTTVDHDGRHNADGASPKTGIHNKVDSLLGKLRVEQAEALRGLKIAPLVEQKRREGEEEKRSDSRPATTSGASVASTQATLATSQSATRPKREASPLLLAVWAEVGRSHALVDKVYELEKELPAMDEAIAKGSQTEAFTLERLRATTAFTASLFFTAWRDSETMQLAEYRD